MRQFGLLKQFRAHHKDRWPFTAEEFPKGNRLGRWFHEQRLRNKRGTLKKPLASLLRSIGFPFREKVLKRSELWCLRFEELKAFRKRHPKRWPSKSEKPSRENVLGAWCHAQSSKRDTGRLSRERISLLDSLGFEWRPKDAIWMRHYLDLSRFFRLHPGRKPRADSASAAERALAAWLGFQRKRIRIGKLEPRRKRLLDRIERAFRWR
jgi:hypothetical protein